MSLPSNGFVFGSAASGSSFRDAIASYRRSQYYVAGSTVASSGEDSVDFDGDDYNIEDEEASVADLSEEALGTAPSFHSQQSRDHDAGLIGQFHWDEDLGRTGPGGVPESVGSLSPSPPAPGIFAAGSYVSQAQRNAQHVAETASGLTSSPQRVSEATPLLRPKVSFRGHAASQVGSPGSYSARRTLEETSSVASGNLATSVGRREALNSDERSARLRRRSSASSSKIHLKSQAGFGGHRTFGQTLFNSIAILLGIGMLSEPLAFAYAGWAAGTALVISYGFLRACLVAPGRNPDLGLGRPSVMFTDPYRLGSRMLHRLSLIVTDSPRLSLIRPICSFFRTQNQCTTQTSSLTDFLQPPICQDVWN
uniref:Amino acid transporter transmembrane domain-containing protein n=1 Tax=Moniliophthora roreri TaxID=221103 RepID=A0A0W0F8Q6_MONRR